MARTQAADYGERREAMLDQAAALFARAGFQGASMIELAGACKVSKSLLYHYFPSKEDLLYEVMTSHLDQLVEDVDAVTSSNVSNGEKVSQLAHAFMRHYIGAVDRQKVLLNELINLPEPRRGAIIRKQRLIIDTVQDLLSGLPTAPKDKARLRALTMLFFGMINWTHTWFDPMGAVSPDDLADMVAALIMPEKGL
ncbi:TetR/AcrR family transcriptional regulator [Sphingomonas crocodyli]|uniref:TetR/AcrR family transcriptional regulator n=1 Tax=Sphingomonas crocodyli TaxID=1979270 RepID=A0A437M751_9SPHN|nr:TetR/AcrR family transcriptional regulator [Sphingomonas crocodyli]RVT93551.1 TetR/AcrR family transcriptional regulator [Sphingomonas crocodyli]